MIIRRKPLGREGIRKPRTLGLSLLREGITRVQSLSVQRQSTADEPIDWGEGVPDDVYTDYDAANQVNQVDSSVVDQADYETSFDDALRQAEQPVPRPANEAQRTARRRVQRQPAEPPPPQVITPPPQPPPAPSRPLRRQALSDGDTMPADLKAMWELHKKLGHIREKPVVTRRPDGSPIPRKRAQIVEMPSKSSGEPEVPRSASPIGAPIQRESDQPGSTIESPQPLIADDEPMLPTRPEPAQLAAGDDTPAEFDAEATLTDFRLDTAADVRRSPSPSAPTPSVPAAPPMTGEPTGVPPGTAREFAPSAQFDGGDPDDSDEEPDTASDVVQRSADEPTNAARRAAIEAAIARVESPTVPDTDPFVSDSFPEDAPIASDGESAATEATEVYQPPASQSPTLRQPTVQRTTQADEAPAFAESDLFDAPDQPQTDVPAASDSSVRRSAIEAAIARAEQPADYPTDSFDMADVSPADSFERPGARPTISVQRQADTNSPITPEQSDPTATPKSAQNPAQSPTVTPPSIQRHAEHTLSSDSVEEAASAAIQRTAIDAAAARADQPTVFDPSATEAFFSDTPQTAADRSERPAAPAIQRQAAYQTPESTASEDESAQDDFSVSPSISSDIAHNDAAAVRRAAIDAAIARAELPSAPDISADIAASATAESVDLTPRPTPVQRQSTPPTLQPPLARAQPNQPFAAEATADQIDVARRVPADSAIAYEEPPPTADDTAEFEPISFDRPDSATESASTPKPTAVQRHAEPSPASPDQDDAIRRAAIDAAIARAELPSAPGFAESEPFDNSESVDYAETPASPARRAVQPQPPETPADNTPPTSADHSASIRRAAIAAAVARAEQPTETESSETFDSAASDSTPTPQSARSRRATVQRHAAPDVSAPPDQTDQIESATAFTSQPAAQRAAHELSSEAPNSLIQRSEAAHRAAIDAAIARAEQPAASDEFEAFAPDVPESSTTATSLPAIQRQTVDSPMPTPIDHSDSVRRAAIDAAIARAELPTLPDADEPDMAQSADPYAEPPATGGRKSTASTAPSAETQPTTARRQTVQRHPGHDDSSAASPELEDDSIRRTPAVRRSAIDAAVARAEQPAATPSFDFPEADADYLDVGDIYDVATGDRPDLPASVVGRSENQTTAMIRRSAESDTPALNWPSTPRTPNRAARTEQPADVTIQRASETESAIEPSESQASADEVQMLQMLGLPPSTPITRSSPSNPPIVRSAAPEAIQRIPVTAEIVQRAETTGANTAAPPPTNDSQQAEPYSSADIEQVAQAVYQSLRNRLRIERERSRGRVK